eukprot:scaffold368081_cov22-Prasinocladus_malaysianus.AAC.1
MATTIRLRFVRLPWRHMVGPERNRQSNLPYPLAKVVVSAMSTSTALRARIGSGYQYEYKQGDPL